MKIQKAVRQILHSTGVSVVLLDDVCLYRGLNLERSTG